MATSSSSALPLKVNPTTPSRPGTATSTGSSTSAANTSLKPPVNTPDISSPHELTAFVESVLEQLDAKFDDMSSQILERMSQMSSRVDALETAIQDIISGGEGLPGTPTTPQSPSVVRRSGPTP